MKTLIITLATVASAMIFSSCGSTPPPSPQNEVIYSGAKGGLDTYSAKSTVPYEPVAAPTPVSSSNWDWLPRLP